MKHECHARTVIGGKKLSQWRESHPLLNQLMHKEETFWFNRYRRPMETALPTLDIGWDDVQDATDHLNLKRFAAYISKVFPETGQFNGIIESPLQFIPVIRLKSLVDGLYTVSDTTL